MRKISYQTSVVTPTSASELNAKRDRSRPSDNASTHGAYVAREELDRAIGGEYILYFKDSRLEARYAQFVWKRCSRSLRGTWLLGTSLLVLHWLPWWMGLNRTITLSLKVPIVALFLVILAQVLVLQLIPCIPRISRSWLAPGTMLVVILVVGVMLLPIASLHRFGILISNDPTYFQSDGNYSSDVFPLLGLLMTTQYCFIVFPLPCSRIWPVPVAGLLMYGFFSLPMWSPHPIADMLVILPSVGIMFFWCLVGRRRAEMLERRDWYSIQRLSADVEKMKKMQALDVAGQSETKSERLWQSFSQALDERNDSDIATWKQKLMAQGFSEDHLQEKTRAIRKTLSEEAGVSVAYLISPEFETLARSSTGMEDPTFYALKDAFFIKDMIGKHDECPRDGMKGCALIDTLPFEHRRKSTHFLSWLWQYKLSSVRSSLVEWIHAENLDAKDVFLYMCFFVNNQYRILIDEVALGSDSLGVIFESNLRRTRQVLAILEGWDSPSYLGRIWTIFEQYTAISLGIPVTIIMPPAAASTLISEFEIGRQGIVNVKDALSRVDSKSAKASVEEDEIRVKEFISSGVGFDVVNAKISSFMIAWVAYQLHSYMNRLVHGDLSEDDATVNGLGADDATQSGSRLGDMSEDDAAMSI